jgi:formate hydrogenlyase subunit 3/multisubunit Na+/H+ antiporter MnhD subunit
MAESYLLLSIFILLFGSGFSWLLRGKVRNAWVVLLTGSAFIFTCLLIPSIMKGQKITASVPFPGSDNFTLSFVGDGPGLIFALIFSLLGMISVIYSLDYMKKESFQAEYFFLTTLMIGALMGLAYSMNLILLYIFWEIASITTWMLVGFGRREEDTAIANKTLIMIFAGSSFMLLGLVMIYAKAHTFNLIELERNSANNLVLIFIFIGIVAKAAVLPLHSWLPDAHTVSPSPISALLSGIVVKIGLLAFLRIFVWTYHISWNWILMLAVFSSIVAASVALHETDLKKIIAYSTISQICYILLGFAILTRIGLAAGLLYFMVHAIGKAGLFLCAGIVEQQCGERDIDRLGGLIKSMPVTGITFALCALSIIGLPPFLGFYSKIMVIMALVDDKKYWIAGFAIITAVLTLLYLFRAFRHVFLGAQKFPNVREGSKLMLACVFLLGFLSLIGGFFIKSILMWINVAVTSLLE